MTMRYVNWENEPVYVDPPEFVQNSNEIRTSFVPTLYEFRNYHLDCELPKGFVRGSYESIVNL